MNARTTLIFICLAAAQPIGPVHSASFDCTKATTKIERLVCSNRKVSDLDEKLARAYAVFLGKFKYPEIARGLQRRWISEIRNRCTDITCLRIEYEKRISQLATSKFTVELLNNCDDRGITLTIGYCLAGRNAVEEQLLADLVDVLVYVKGLDKSQEAGFRQRQAAWRKDVQCHCDHKVIGYGTGIGTGIAGEIHACTLTELNARVTEIASIFDGAPLDYGGKGPKSCTGIAQEREERNQEYALHIAVKASDIETTKKLLSAGRDPNQIDDEEQVPLVLAIRNRNAPICNLLLQSGAKIGYALNEAAYYGDVKLVKLFLKHGASINGDKRPPLVDASYGKKIETTKFLVSNGADVNGKGFSVPPIYAAAQSGSFEVVQFLADSGADINRQDGMTGRTALMWAALHAKNNEQLEVVQTLIRNGAQTRTKDKTGETAVDYAKKNGNLKLIRMLEER